MSKEVLAKKQRALTYFTKKLLASPIAKNIDRIILFGSLAKGKADDYSDIDLLVFTPTSKKIREAIWDACMETYQRYEESIEPMLYSSKKYKNPDSYFLYYSINKGKQIYP